MRAGAWELRETVLEGGKVVYAIPSGQTGTTVLGWVEQMNDGSWRRWPPDEGAPRFGHPEQAVLDVLEYAAHENEETSGPEGP